MLSLARQLNTAQLAFAFRVSLVALLCVVGSIVSSWMFGSSAGTAVAVVAMAAVALVCLSVCLLTFAGVCVPLYRLIDRLSKASLPVPAQQGWPAFTSAIESALVETPTPPPRQVVR